MDWIDRAQEVDHWRAVVNTLMNLLVPKNVGKFFTRCTIDKLSRMAQLHEVQLFSWTSFCFVPYRTSNTYEFI
jgi:hypothetical protein